MKTEDIFKKELVHKCKIPSKYVRILGDIVKARKDYDKGKLTKAELQNVNKKSNDIMKFLIEYIQRKRGRDLEKTKIRVKYGKKFGEVILLDKKAFIIEDIDAEEKIINKAEIREDGGLKNINKSSMEE